MLQTRRGRAAALALALASAGCGRFGYDAPGADGEDAAATDAPPEPPGCSAGLGFTRPIVVTNGGAALADSQLEVVVDTGALVAAGQLRSDCADVRFVDPATDQALPHWLEAGCGGSETHFWLRVAPLAAGTTTLAMV